MAALVFGGPAERSGEVHVGDLVTLVDGQPLDPSLTAAQVPTLNPKP